MSVLREPAEATGTKARKGLVVKATCHHEGSEITTTRTLVFDSAYWKNSVSELKKAILRETVRGYLPSCAHCCLQVIIRDIATNSLRAMALCDDTVPHLHISAVIAGYNQHKHCRVASFPNHVRLLLAGVRVV